MDSLTSTIPMKPATAQLGLDVTHLRLVPHHFPKGMHFHFDGLAALLRFRFNSSTKTLAIDGKPYESQARTAHSLS